MLTLLPLCAVIFLIGYGFKRFRFRRWLPIKVNRQTLRFPNYCPSCLGFGTQSSVIEKSPRRPIAYLGQAVRTEHIELKIPYCSNCSDKITHNRKVGFLGSILLLVLSAGSFVALCLLDFSATYFFWLAPLALLILFVWPFSEYLKFRQCAVLLRDFSPEVIEFRLRRKRYFDFFESANVCVSKL